MQAAIARQPVIFDGLQAKAIAAGFADYIARSRVPVHACAILPDHVHFVVGRFRLSIERICEQLKGAATAQMNREDRHPFADQPYRNDRLPTPWARKGWWVYLNSVVDIRRSIRYVNENPVRAGLRSQRWSFVSPYERFEEGTLRVTRYTSIVSFSGCRAAALLGSRDCRSFVPHAQALLDRHTDVAQRAFVEQAPQQGYAVRRAVIVESATDCD